MVDAAAAVAAAAATPTSSVRVVTSSPTAGAVVQLSADASSASSGRSLVAYAWELVDGGGSVTAFSGATNASTASVLPAAAGTFTVQLTVTDNFGAQASSQLGVTVAAAPVAAGRRVVGDGV